MGKVDYSDYDGGPLRCYDVNDLDKTLLFTNQPLLPYKASTLQSEETAKCLRKSGNRERREEAPGLSRARIPY